MEIRSRATIRHGGTTIPWDARPSAILRPLVVDSGPGLTGTPKPDPSGPDKLTAVFGVTAATLSTNAEVRTACPATVKFRGYIHANGAGMVRYRFVHTGKPGAVREMSFDRAEGRPVLFDVQVGDGDRSGTVTARPKPAPRGGSITDRASRRSFLRVAGSSVVVGAGSRVERARRRRRRRPRLCRFRASPIRWKGNVEIIATGYIWTEGPVWVGGEQGHLLFSDVPGNAIYSWDGKRTTAFLAPSGYQGFPIPASLREAGSNGLALGRGGLLLADSGTRAHRARGSRDASEDGPRRDAPGQALQQPERSRAGAKRRHLPHRSALWSDGRQKSLRALD